MRWDLPGGLSQIINVAYHDDFPFFQVKKKNREQGICFCLWEYSWMDTEVKRADDSVIALDKLTDLKKTAKDEKEVNEIDVGT